MHCLKRAVFVPLVGMGLEMCCLNRPGLMPLLGMGLPLEMSYCYLHVNGILCDIGGNIY